MMDIWVNLFLIGGLFFIFVGTLGVLRFPDIYCRAHALNKAMTLGISLLLISATLHIGVSDLWVKAFAIMIFQYSTIPLSGHVLALTAFRFSSK
ncbi:MAG: monovalent cation/H(+) antiporter subunit G [Candidatus Margulisbacteria bacterium]|nr:monovalent cation/H(+) antiporter subunit G [Candidatus Margulisiibacteriota bacterium]